MVGLGVDLSDLPVYADVNVTGTAVLLEAMGRHGIPRLVIASSMVVYGEGAYDCVTHGRVRPAPRHPGDLAAGRFEPRCPQCAQPLGTATVTEDAPLDPRNAYAASKVAQEHLAASWARMTGGAAVGLRYHNVYGPRMPRDTPYSGVAAIFRSRLENGVPPRVFEDGGQRRDFVHVRDVAQANLLALEAVDRAVPAAGGSAGPTAAPAALGGAGGGPGRLSRGRRRARRFRRGRPGRAAVLQRRQRRTAHGGRDGHRAGRRLRRRARAGGHRRIPPRGRPARGGLPRPPPRTSASGPRSGSPRAWPSSPAPPSASPRWRLPRAERGEEKRGGRGSSRRGGAAGRGGGEGEGGEGGGEEGGGGGEREGEGGRGGGRRRGRGGGEEQGGRGGGEGGRYGEGGGGGGEGTRRPELTGEVRGS